MAKPDTLKCQVKRFRICRDTEGKESTDCLGAQGENKQEGAKVMCQSCNELNKNALAVLSFITVPAGFCNLG